MNGLNGEGGRTDGYILGASRLRCTVAHPLSFVSDDRLTRLDIDSALPAFNAEEPFQDERILVELGGLPGLDPSLQGYAYELC